MQKCCIHRTYWTRFVYFLDENMASLMFICRFSCFTLLFFSVEIMNFPRNGKLLFPESEWMEEKVDSTFYICCYCRWPLACGLFVQVVIFFFWWNVYVLYACIQHLFDIIMLSFYFQPSPSMFQRRLFHLL